MGAQSPSACLRGRQLSEGCHVGPRAQEARSSDASQEARNQGFYVNLSIVKPWLRTVFGFCFSPALQAVQNPFRGLARFVATPLSPVLGDRNGLVSSWPQPQIPARGEGVWLLPWAVEPHPHIPVPLAALHLPKPRAASPSPECPIHTGPGLFHGGPQLGLGHGDSKCP